MIHLSRRSFVQSICVAGATSPLLAACATDMPFFKRQGAPIGIQLYTLSDMLATDLEGALAAVARIGYETVETPSYMGKTPAQLREMLTRNGLKCTSAHIGMRPGTDAEPGLRGDLGKLAADMHTIGATHVYCPAMAIPDDIALKPEPNEGYAFISRVAAAMTPDHWKRAADELSAIGRKLKASGITFGYHNHNFEFVKIGDKTGYDLLVQGADPSVVSFELDVGWAAAAGNDIVELFARHSGRYTAMHVKDIKADTQSNTALKMDPADVGAGKLDWKTILPAARKAGVTNFFLEQEPPFATSRVVAAENGYKYLSTLEA